MKKMSIADRFNVVYKEIVNDNKISDYFANSQAREFLESQYPELNLGVTEFLATMMTIKPNVKIDFKDNKNGVLLDCAYEDILRRLIFNEKGTIVFDESRANNKEKAERV